MLEFMLGLLLGGFLGYLVVSYAFYQLAIDSSWREWIEIRDEARKTRIQLELEE
tara:strand:- start:179 stop:340 length:162 start_codon:yes stop_codon:yes gene_type:complete